MSDTKIDPLALAGREPTTTEEDDLDVEAVFDAFREATREIVASSPAASGEETPKGDVGELTSALAAIHQATRDDAKGEWWTLRRWCDQRGIFHDDIQGGERLTGIVAGEALKRFTGRKP